MPHIIGDYAMSKELKIINREQWLGEAAKVAERELFNAAGYHVPANIRYSVSLPSRNATGMRNATIGQCWSDTVSSDGTFEIFISPRLDEERQVFATLVHEMVHATVGLAAGHKKPFKDCAVAVGLGGKMTATHMVDETWERMAPMLLAELGPFPHAAMNLSNKPKKQSTRMIKIECVCGYGPLRASRRVLEHATPICPMCQRDMEVV
jgi:hypothetical protein